MEFDALPNSYLILKIFMGSKGLFIFCSHFTGTAVITFRDYSSLIWCCSFTVHTGAGLIVPEVQEDGKVLPLFSLLGYNFILCGYTSIILVSVSFC